MQVGVFGGGGRGGEVFGNVGVQGEGKVILYV